MKIFILVSLLYFFPGLLLSASGQNTEDCKGKNLFSPIAKHTQYECIQKEFDKLEIKRKDKAKGIITEAHEGEYIKITYRFDGDFNNRPSGIQIYRNYANAITTGGGEVLFIDDYGISGKLKKGTGVYWIHVTTDGSGFYWTETLKEAAMNQDVVLTADEINNNLEQDGKVLFYGIFFDTDKAIIKPESAVAIQALAAFLKNHSSLNYFIVGHTDNTGVFENNLKLSKERALAVVNELVTHYGVSKNQLSAQGIASLAPAASNDTEDGRAKNRRVEMVKQ